MNRIQSSGLHARSVERGGVSNRTPDLFSGPSISALGRLACLGLALAFAARAAGQAAPPEIAWTFPVGDAISNSPAIDRQGVVFVSSTSGTLCAVEGGTGAERWRVAADSALSAPLVDEAAGAVWVRSAWGLLYSFKADTGEELGHWPVGAGTLAPPVLGAAGRHLVEHGENSVVALDSQGGAMGSPLSVSGTPWAIGANGVLFGGTVGAGSVLWSVDTATGKTNWDLGTYKEVGAPAVSPQGYLIQSCVEPTWLTSARAADARSGAVKWDVFLYLAAGFPAERHAVRATEPVIGADGTVFIGESDVMRGFTRQYYADASVFALNSDDGSQRWKSVLGSFLNYRLSSQPLDTNEYRFTGPLLAGPDHTVYAPVNLNGENALVALDSATGTNKYTLATPEPLTALAMDSAGRLLAGSPSGTLYAFATGASGASGGLAASPWPKQYGNARNTGEFAEPAQAPVLAAVPDQALEAYRKWTYPLALENALFVRPGVTYALDTNAPTGMTIDSSTGVLTWRPGQSQAPSTNRIVVWASTTDGTGEPRSFTLTVGETTLVSWEHDLGDAISTCPAVGDDGTVYVVSTSLIAVAEDLVSPGMIATALDPDGGTVKWRRQWPMDVSPDPVPAPVIGDDGLLYVTAGDTVRALDPATGDQIWQSTGSRAYTTAPLVGDSGRLYLADAAGRVQVLDSLTGGQLTEFSVAGIPGLIDRDGVLYTVSGPPAPGAQVHAYDSVSGGRFWSSPELGLAGGSLALGPDGTVYVCFGTNSIISNMRGGTIALDPATGSILWKSDSPAVNMQPPVGPAVGGDGRVFVGWYNDNDSGLAISRSGFGFVLANACGFGVFDGGTGAPLPGGSELVYYEVPYAGHAGGQQQPLPLGIVTTCPAVTEDGVVLIGSQNNGVGVMNAVDSTTGALLWTLPAGGGVSAPTVGKDGVAYFGDDKGVIHAVPLGPASALASAGWPKTLGNARNSGRPAGRTAVNPLGLRVPGTQTVLYPFNLRLTLAATNPAAPAATFKFQLVQGPVGMTLDADTGELAWTPSQAQGFSTNAVLVSVTDNSTPPLRRAGRFSVIVIAANTGPSLVFPARATARPLRPLFLSVHGTDSDVPAQKLTFGLSADAPAGMTIDDTGLIAWTPSLDYAGTTNRFNVRLADSQGAMAAAEMVVYVVETNHARLPGEVVWDYPLQSGSSSGPAIDSDGALYFGAGLLDRKAFALDTATGRRLWDASVGDSAAGASVALAAQGRAYLVSYSQKLFALDRASGAQLWEFSTSAFSASDPLVGPDDTVYFKGDALYALDGRTGSKRWRRAGVGQPAAIGPDGTLYTSGDGLLALDPKQGDLLWSADVSRVAVAVSRDGTVYAVGDRLLALDAASGEVRWERPAPAVDSSLAQYAGYAYPVLAPGGALIVVEHAPYIGSNLAPRGKLVAFDAVTGERRWETAVREEIAATPAVAADGTIYAPLVSGLFLAFDGANGLVKWGLSLGAGGSGTVTAGPPNIGENGWIYFLGSRSNAVFAVDGGTAGGLASTDWPRYRGNARNTGSLAPEKANRAPVFPPETTLAVPEGGSLTMTDAAEDPDGLAPTYTLAEAPEGMSFDPATGVLQWQPTEAQGPGNYPVRLEAADHGYPSLSATHLIQVTVREVNQPPMLVAPESQTLAPLAPWSAAFAASDPDIPANPLSFELLSAPEGLSLDAGARKLAWTPVPGQSGHAFDVVLKVSDGVDPVLSATQSFTLTVQALPPQLTTPKREYTVPARGTLQFTNTAADLNWSARRLVFVLDLDAPPGAALDRESGVFAWTAPDRAATNRFTIWVTQSEPPYGRASGVFTVVTLAPVAAPRILSVERGSAEGAILVKWQTAPGGRYRLESTPSLADPDWRPAGEVATASGDELSATDSTSGAQRFYRVVRLE